MSRKVLWLEYTYWARDSGERFPLDRRAFFDRVRGYEVREIKFRELGELVRGFKGIGLRRPSDAPQKGAGATK